METWYKAVLIGVLTVATLIGIIAGRMQTTQSAPAIPTAVATVVAPPLRGQIAILSTRFLPSTVTIRVGETVTWVNRDTRTHGPVADNSAFSSGALSPGQRFSWTPSRAGTYPYADFLDPSLRGTIVVRP